MRVCVKLFGPVREAVGAKELEMALPEGTSLLELRALLAREHEIFDAMGPRLLAAINQQAADPGAVLQEGDEVAFLPPVSGGAGAGCQVEAGPLDVGAVVARVTGPQAGAIVTFVGAVRDHSRGQSIRHLEYESYAEMAVREMDRICAQAAERWTDARVSAAHRVGHLEVGEIAVVVAASAPHRAEAFEACRFVIDTLKQSVPIWKKEVTTSGEYWVEEHA